MPAVGLGGGMPLQDRAKVGTGRAGFWLGVSWVEKSGSVVRLASCRARGALLHGTRWQPFKG